MTTPILTARHELGSLIKAARQNCVVDGHRLSQLALGHLLGCTQGKIQKIETGRVRIEPRDVEQVILHLDVDAATAGKMRKLATLNAVGDLWSGERALIPVYARRYMELEQIATEILSWHEMRIPGPLQSTQFMLQQLQAAGHADTSPYMRNSEQRKKLFHQPQLRRYQCVLAEEALRRAASALGRTAACDEIDHLLAINDSTDPQQLADSRTSVFLLPSDAKVAYLPNDFSILHFTDSERSVIYIEHVAGAQYVTSPNAVETASDAWQTLARAALDRDWTRQLLLKLRAEYAAK